MTSTFSPRVLICGSVAFDTIMVFRGRFGEHILPDQVHILNVSFLVDDLRREWGGCAGNIAYNLNGIGGNAVIMATVGDDGVEYQQRLAKLGVDTTYLKQLPGTYTAQCYITTDLNDNQLTAFHPGAMLRSHENRITPQLEVDLAIIGPDGRDGMVQHVEDCHASGIPCLFDPGQGLPLFDGPELLRLIELSDYLAVNDYEAKLVQEKTKLSLPELAKRVKALVVTMGGQGSEIWAGGELIRIPAVPAAAVVDPTGCGDAYRAGLLYGIVRGWDWQKTGRLASLLGAMKIAHRGAQNHAVRPEAVAEAYAQHFGESLW